VNLSELKKQTDKKEVKAWIDNNLKNYLTKNPSEENVSEIEHIIDYLNSDKAPTRLRKMSYKEAKSSSEKWLKSLLKKGMNIIEIPEKDYTTKIDFKDGFRLVQLVSKNAFEREGSMMGHCVGSYFGKDVFIYSLRDDRNMPHCTIEITANEDGVNQIKGKGNGSIHPKYIEYVIQTLSFFDLKVRSSEMENLGYLKLDTSFREYINKHFTGIKTFTFNNDEFFYKGSKLKEKRG